MDRKSLQPPPIIGRAIDSSYAKLKWNVEGIFDKIKIIQNELNEKLKDVPIEKVNKRKKIMGWQEQLNNLSQKIEHIRETKRYELEEVLSYDFITPDLLLLSFVQPSIRNTFKELRTFFSELDSSPLAVNEFDDFLKLPDATKVLAFIGDAALDFALVHISWQPNLSKVGDMHQQKKNIVSNENLARLCDKWDLYDSRIHLDPSAPAITEETIYRTKGTIIEAIFGVIYVENGLEPIISSIRVLK